VRPAVSFVDASDNEVATNNTGRMLVASYCNFTVRVIAENVFKTLNVSVTGDDVEKVSVVSKSGNTLQVGQSIRLLSVYANRQHCRTHDLAKLGRKRCER
jgi:hypothetical protein